MKQRKLMLGLFCLLMLFVSGCVRTVSYCPAYPQPGELVSKEIEKLYYKYEHNIPMTSLELEQLYREDALFKLEDKLKLCR